MKKLLFFALLLINYQSPLLAKCIKGDCQNGPGIYEFALKRVPTVVQEYLKKNSD